jgi:hypothetical protein
MNTAKALKREPVSADTLDENPTERQEFMPKVESTPLTSFPQRAPAPTPLLMQMLARVEGVARWGLNE